MKRNDLNAIITGIVHRYIEDGWVLEMDNSSYSDVDGVHFLSRGRERVAVGIRRPERGELDGRLSDLRGLDPRILFECRAPKRAFDWLVPENAIGERVFFKVADDWYVEDICSFHPTKAFLDKWVRGEYGWKTVKPSDVLVKRERICGRGFYFITKVSRKGANPVLTVDIPRVR